MATPTELEEMVVRFVADQAKYVADVKNVQAVTVQVAKAVTGSAKLVQDSAGRWRQQNGQFATIEQMRMESARAAAAAAGDATGQANKYAAALNNAANAMEHAKKSQDSLNKSQGQSGFGQFKDKAMGVAAPVAAAMSFGAMAAMATKAVALSAEAESVQITFDTIIGDLDKAAATTKELRAFADWSPFNTGEVMEAGKMMLAMGTAADDLVPTMTMMGDVAGALNIPIKDLSYLMGTLKSVGRATTVDLNQFALRGIGIWRELATMMYGDPKAVDKVRKAVEAGQVSFDIVEKAFKRMTSQGGQFYQGMEKQAKGLSGLWATFQSETENTLKAVGDEIVKSLDLKWVLQQVTDLTKGFTTFFKALSPETKRFVVFTAVAVVGIMGIVGAVILLGTVFNTMFGGMGILIGLVVTGAAMLASWAASTGTLSQLWDKLVKNAKAFYDWVKPLVPLIATVLGVLFPWLGALILIVKHWADIQAAAKRFFDWLQPVVREAWITFQVLADRVKAVLLRLWSWIEQQAEKVFGFLRRTMEGVFGKINWSNLQTGLMDLMIFVEFAADRIPTLWNVGMKAIKYFSLAAMSWVLENAFQIPLLSLLPMVFAASLINWKELFIGMMAAAAAFGNNLVGLMKDSIGGALTAIGTAMNALVIKAMTGQFDANTLAAELAKIGVQGVKGFQKSLEDGLKDITPKFTAKGIKFDGLEKLKEQSREELMKSLGDLKLDFDKFKAERKAREDMKVLKEFGLELLKVWGPAKKAAEQAGKDTGQAMGQAIGDGLKQGIQGIDAVLVDSLQAKLREEQYLQYLRDMFGKGFNPSLPAGAVPVKDYIEPEQAKSPMLPADQQERAAVINLLTQIAGGIGQMVEKEPLNVKGAGL